jgi:ATP-dependent DNA helicase RecG
MKGKEKDAVMQDFTARKIDLLIATTVIEVGVDVPNASLMIIENAERLGLAQLHQLRGRVGRGTEESSCVLVFDPPLTENAKTRIDTMRNTNDGFKIAQVDLEIRGPGEVLGTRQTGMLELRIANIMRDQDLIPLVQETAKQLLQDHPKNADAVIQRWLGRSTEYGQV